MSVIPGPDTAFFEVLCWSGGGAIKRVPLLTPDRRPLIITQNAHQLDVTRDHLVILDAGGTIEASKLGAPPNSVAAGEAVAPRPESYLYVVDRSELRSTTGTATVRRALVPREAGHFTLDYDSSPARLVLHVAHTSASDFVEWVQPYDTHPFTGAGVRSDLVNAITPVCYDAGVIGRYEIDAATGEVLDESVFHDDWTWGTGGLTARNPNTPATTLGDLFHSNRVPDRPGGAARVLGVRWSIRIESSPPTTCHGRGFRPAWSAPITTPAVWSTATRSRVIVSRDPTFVPRNGTARGSADGHISDRGVRRHRHRGLCGHRAVGVRRGPLAEGPVVKLASPEVADADDAPLGVDRLAAQHPTRRARRCRSRAHPTGRLVVGRPTGGRHRALGGAARIRGCACLIAPDGDSGQAGAHMASTMAAHLRNKVGESTPGTCADRSRRWFQDPGGFAARTRSLTGRCTYRLTS
ncbi:MAG: hypothetical protein M5U19_17870 [Microthrixaceae bacterium]|nr:hypothetical protein [Microthrixaceae bacterium]